MVHVATLKINLFRLLKIITIDFFYVLKHVYSTHEQHSQ